jgi:hypothetical protein
MSNGSPYCSGSAGWTRDVWSCFCVRRHLFKPRFLGPQEWGCRGGDHAAAMTACEPEDDDGEARNLEENVQIDDHQENQQGQLCARSGGIAFRDVVHRIGVDRESPAHSFAHCWGRP